MADQQATFAIELDVQGADDAESLADALSGLKDQIKADQAAVREMEQALKRLSAAGATGTDTFKQLRDQLAAKKASLGAATESYVKLGGTFGDVSGGASEASGGLQGLLQSLQATGGPMGALAGKANQALSAIGKSGLAGAFVIGAALAVLFAAAILGAVVALAGFALQAASAARSSRLLGEAATGSAEGARELAQAVDAAAGKAALSRDKLNEMALAMARSGLSGRALESALSASAVAAATLGDEAGRALQGIAEKAAKAGKLTLTALDLKGAGVSFDDVAGALAEQLGIGFAQAQEQLRTGKAGLEAGLAALDSAVQKKLGKIAEAQLLDFNQQIARTKENIGRLFADVKIDSFLGGLSEVTSLLDQNTASGRALKTIAETALDPLFDAVGGKGGVVKDFIRGMVIGLLSITVIALKVRNALRDAFGDSAGIDGTKAAIEAGIVVLYALAAVVGVVAGIVYGLYAIFIKPFVALYEVVTQAGGALDALGGYFSAAYDYIAGLDFGQLASDIVQGLVDGIVGGAGAVAAAFANLASSGLAAMKGVLGIASPAKVPKLFGRYTGQGFTGGLDEEKPRVQAAARGMVDFRAAGASARANAAQGGPGARAGGRAVIIQKLEAIIQANSPAEFYEKLVEVVETAAAQAGAEPDPA